MAHEIEIVRGTTNNFSLSIVDEDTGVHYVPRPGDIAVFGVKKCNTASGLVITKRASISEDGTAFFTICPEDTADLCCDKYLYDIGLESGTDFYNIIPATPFRITNNITFKGCK